MGSPQPEGFLAIPPSGKGRGVLVLHPWWGLNDTMRTVCARLAEAGFVAFAPDLYRGRTAATIEEAETLMQALDPDSARKDIAAAVPFLAEAATGAELGVVAFSMGTWFAMDLSNADPGRIRAVAVFYGTGPPEYPASRAAYLGHFAESDPYEPDAGVKALEASLRAAGRPVTFHRYPGTGHWFFEPDRADAYEPVAAALAWDRTLGFLKSSLAH
jgi:carboxymethylenebutenolidase